MAETLQMVIDKAVGTASVTGAWRQGPKISFSDLKGNTGNIEWLTPGLEGVPINKPVINIPPERREFRGGRLVVNAPVMGFGKFKEETMDWVKENEPDYWEWCCENIPSFSKRVSEGKY